MTKPASTSPFMNEAWAGQIEDVQLRTLCPCSTTIPLAPESLRSPIAKSSLSLESVLRFFAVLRSGKRILSLTSEVLLLPLDEQDQNATRKTNFGTVTALHELKLCCVLDGYKTKNAPEYIHGQPALTVRTSP
jgi:hypothetical protein